MSVCNALISILDIASIILLLLIINYYVNGQFPRALFFLSGVNMHVNALWLLTCFFLFFLLKNTCAYFIQRLQYQFVYRIASRVSETNMLAYLEGVYKDHALVDSSVWIKKISQHPIEFSHYILAGIQLVITETVLIILSIVVILLFNAKLFLLLLFILMPAILVLSFFIRQRLKKTREKIRSAGERSLQHLREALDGYVESNLYHKNLFFSKRYARYQEQLNTYLSELQAIQGAPSRLIEIFAVSGLFVMILIYTMYKNSTAVDVLTIGAFMGAAYKIIPGIVKILNATAQIRTYSYTVESVKVIKSDSHSAFMNQNKAPLNMVSFVSVYFAYDAKTILSGLSFTLSKGSFTGISGKSGKGKSTIINMLLGFIEEEKGAIEFNGKKITARERKQYWSSIAYVKQQPFIMHDSILMNITMEEQQYDRLRLNEAILHSGLESLVNSFPEGVHKIISENGRNISGGQRQRIAIARALYKNADLIILDEPFNELDHAAELILLHYLQLLSENGKMIILITHNAESLAYCNHIISIDSYA